MDIASHNFRELFQKAVQSDHEANRPDPYGYQCRLARGDEANLDQPSTLTQGRVCQSLLIDIPTGLGKTAAVVMAWLWNRVMHPDPNHRKTWPRRLVYCLPMRTLVEQTHKDTKGWLKNLDLTEQVGVHLLMGGEERGEWDFHPERNAVLIGTQDMLLSRALNRGYGMSRFRWPMHFAFLNNDALWVMDEIQLMGVGVETSAQLDGFRSAGPAPVGTCATWWMSATLVDAQLDTVDHRKPESGWKTIVLSENEKQAPEVRQRIEARKPIEQAELSLSAATKSKYEKNLAALIVQKHQPDTLTLVIVNWVNRAQAVYNEVCKWKGIRAEEVALIHSRFRPKDRKQHEKLLSKEAKGNRIVIATQAVEAGVDISARLLITELAPWSSLVQRFGRCNRYGERTDAEILWIDLQPKDEKDDLCLPYDLPSLKTARANLEKVSDASPLKLAAIKAEPKPVIRPVLRRKDLFDLFDTTADLCGQDIDISRYIRDGNDTDVQVFWRDFPDEEAKDRTSPERDELCRVGISAFAEFKKKIKPAHVWVWNHLSDRWDHAEHIIPGGVYRLKVDSGGYSDKTGWTGDPKDKPTPCETAQKENDSTPDDPQTFGQAEWKTIEEHTADVKEALEHLLGKIALDQEMPIILQTAALWHDVGKAHPVFQSSFPEKPLWAKSPHKRGKPRQREGEKETVKFFRHELASALAWLAKGPADHPERDLVAYLIAAHHGKVRLSIRSLPEEKPTPSDPDRLYARGVWDGDELPAVKLDANTTVGPVTLDLTLMKMGEDEKTGPSWLSRMIALRDRLGPFRLAYYEALLRVADQNASAKAAAIKNEVHPNQPIS